MKTTAKVILTICVVAGLIAYTYTMGVMHGATRENTDAAAAIRRANDAHEECIAILEAQTDTLNESSALLEEMARRLTPESP